MKHKFILLVGMLMLLVPAPLPAQGTAFTYQGRLQHGGSAASGLYEMSFTLHDAATNGNAVGTPQTLAPVPVSNGLFTATLDFGAAAFLGAERWLEIAVTVFGSDQPVVTLVPRQPLTPAPYSLHAANAAGLMSFTETPVEIKVNGERVLRLEPTRLFFDTVAGAPNIIGGSSANFVGWDVTGATIAGGGAVTNFGQNGRNAIDSSFGTIGGGFSNTISTMAGGATIAGGSGNTIKSEGGGAVIGGGSSNTIEEDAGHATIAGGWDNRIWNDGDTIGGGYRNTTFSGYATVAGGQFNSADGWSAVVSGGEGNIARSPHATVGGGHQNYSGASFSTVSGGLQNTNDGLYSTISGGYLNWGFGGGSTVGGGHRNVASGDMSTVGGGVGNQATENFATVGGGANNAGGGLYATTGGGLDNQANRYAAFIGGGQGNDADGEGAALAGGFFNHITAGFSSIGGGQWNQIAAAHAAIGGGLGNQITENDIAQGVPPADYAVIGGGLGNIGSGQIATIGGGDNNTASGWWATVAGGTGNSSSGESATVGGGNGNASLGDSATVAGGEQNSAIGEHSFVGGGEENEAKALNAVVGGGSSNTASGTNSAVGGGWVNQAPGHAATVPGGALNLAAGGGSFAAGSAARALHDGSFVWSDGDGVFDLQWFPSTTTNEFAVRARGGVRFVSAIDNDGAPTAGVTLASGSGTWSSLSDRHAKENFTAANPRDILDKVAALPLASWNYKAQDKSIRHLGPVAQDFHAAFGLGENDRAIATVDADGVALVAIQGLNQKLEERLKAKDVEIELLKTRLLNLERLLTHQK